MLLHSIFSLESDVRSLQPLGTPPMRNTLYLVSASNLNQFINSAILSVSVTFDWSQKVKMSQDESEHGISTLAANY